MNLTKKNPGNMNTKIIPIRIMLYLLLLLFLASCKVAPAPPKVLKPSVNVIILLDLSARLIKQDGQPSRDKELIEYICSEMVNIIRDNNGVDRSKEMIKIQIAYQDKIPYSTRRISDSLNFKMSKEVKGGIPAIEKKLLDRFPRNLDRLYEAALFSKVPEDYTGADIPRYFIQDLNNDIKRDSMTTNLLFILTDGYVINGQDNNLMPDVNIKFPGLKVMVLEVSAKNNDNSSELIQQSWDYWFAKMAVNGYTLRNIGPIAEIKVDITRFLKGTLELSVPGRFVTPPLSSDLKTTIPKSDSKLPKSKTSDPGTNMNTSPIKNPGRNGATEIPNPPKVVSKTISLPNGDVYAGETLNGRPHGLGTLTFKDSRQICENDINKQRADSGDRIVGTWRNGEVEAGRLFSSTGVLKFTIICGSV
jgi:hypothetical protein